MSSKCLSPTTFSITFTEQSSAVQCRASAYLFKNDYRQNLESDITFFPLAKKKLGTCILQTFVGNINFSQSNHEYFVCNSGIVQSCKDILHYKDDTARYSNVPKKQSLLQLVNKKQNNVITVLKSECVIPPKILISCRYRYVHNTISILHSIKFDLHWLSL